MFRAYSYLVGADNNPQNGVRVTTAPVDTYETASELLDLLLAKPGFNGGDIEQEVPGIGWVVADEDHIESMMILARRRED